MLGFRLVLFIHYAAVKQMNLSIGMTRVARIVRDHTNGCALLVQLAQEFHHSLAVGRVEVSSRLVRQQYQRIARDSSRDRDALLLTARELARKMFGAMSHADAFKRIHHSLLALGRLDSAIGQRQLDVLENIEVTNQIKTLKDESDLAVANARAFGERQVRNRFARQRVGSVGGRIEQAEDGQQR